MFSSGPRNREPMDAPRWSEGAAPGGASARHFSNGARDAWASGGEGRRGGDASARGTRGCCGAFRSRSTERNIFRGKRRTVHKDAESGGVRQDQHGHRGLALARLALGSGVMDELLIRVAEQVAKHGGGVGLSCACARRQWKPDNRENEINAFGMDVRRRFQTPPRCFLLTDPHTISRPVGGPNQTEYPFFHDDDDAFAKRCALFKGGAGASKAYSTSARTLFSFS